MATNTFPTCVFRLGRQSEETFLRENLVFVDATKPGQGCGMWDNLSLLSEMIHRDQGDRKKAGIWHSYSCQGQRKLSGVVKAQVIKV